MNGNRIVAGIVGLAVCVMLVGSLLVPIISEAQDDQEVVYNNIINESTYSKLVDDDLDGVNMVIEWDTVTQVLTVDGSAITVSQWSNTLFVSDQGRIGFSKASGTSELYIGGMAAVILTGPVTATIASGVITVTCGVDSYTITPIEWLFVPDNEGNYKNYANNDATKTLYVNGIDDIYFCGLISSQSIGLFGGHGGSCTLWDVADDPSYDMTYTIERVQGYTDLYEFVPSSYAVSTEAGTNPDLTPFSPYWLMVPLEITAHTDVNSSIIGLLGAIPVVVIAAILIYAVRPVLLRGRND
ncbi:hypothetical protein [Methanothrix soehngenii]|uniref:hypothetical protein n=1 Tax=Methanothrix soehngenii TaxID=2223 RepID=UPI002A3673D1|nr:hypothetical protein [Methanothrix soehngenii]MDY0413044.1 hypothetical protein [Methanothrix soehngenii]